MLYVDEYGRLLDAGVETGIVVARHSKRELVPSLREYKEEIPGRHGELVFGVEVAPRMIELECFIETEKETRGDLRHMVAGLLSPLNGDQAIAFADDPGRMYYGRLSEAVQIESHGTADVFTVAIKCSDPFAYAIDETVQTGSGYLNNEGSVNTPLTIEIIGPVTDPTVMVGTAELKWTGALTESDHLIIDSRTMTVTFNGVNAASAFMGDFPFLRPGMTEVIAAASGTTTWKFRNRWL